MGNDWVSVKKVSLWSWLRLAIPAGAKTTPLQRVA